MSRNVDFISHKKSKLKNQDGSPKLPLASALLEGEIAINFAKDVETISIKNESGDVVTFSSDNYYADKKLGSGFTGANSAVTVTSALLTKADVSSVPPVDGYADSVMYNPTTHYVEFYHGTTAGTKVFEYDASPFIIDGMVQSVEIKDVTSGESQVTCLVVSFNTDAGKQDINIPISLIFDPNNYYTKSEINSTEYVISLALNDLKSNKLDVSAYTPTDLSDYYKKSETSGASQISTALSNKADSDSVYLKSETSGKTELSTAFGTKVNSGTFNSHTSNSSIHFTTGDVQTQIDNSISGKVNVSDIITAITPSNSGSTNPIATNVVAENELIVSSALNDLSEGKLDKSAFIYSSVTVTSNLSNATCPTEITGTSKSGAQAIVIYVNNSTTTDRTVTVSTSYKSPDGQQISLKCPKNGYCEMSYLNIDGTIYARGI